MGRGGLTISMALVLVIEPATFVTTTEYSPVSTVWTFVRLNDEAVASTMLDPFTCH